MRSSLSLSQYVKKRNGVPLGANRSMRNMLSRSFGAESFPVFWHYWNPIWGYYLSRNVMRPLATLLNIPIAIPITFLVSGALHDVAVSIVKWRTVVFFTPWFGLMGLMVMASKSAEITYGHFAWPVRALINASFIFISLGATYFVESMYI
ncbi:acyltransferase [Psychrosphaera sp.]|nr:acyltransferase [Psychrosphaera sp.]